jgi:hypothetical protein
MSADVHEARSEEEAIHLRTSLDAEVDLPSLETFFGDGRNRYRHRLFSVSDAVIVWILALFQEAKEGLKRSSRTIDDWRLRSLHLSVNGERKEDSERLPTW